MAWKTRKEHFEIVSAAVKAGIDKGDWKAAFAACGALNRFQQRGGSGSDEFTGKDSIAQAGDDRYIHRGDFFGRIVENNGNTFVAVDLGKRATMKALAGSKAEVKIAPLASDAKVRIDLEGPKAPKTEAKAAA